MRLISVYAAQKQKWIPANKTGEFEVRTAQPESGTFSRPNGIPLDLRGLSLRGLSSGLGDPK